MSRLYSVARHRDAPPEYHPPPSTLGKAKDKGKYQAELPRYAITGTAMLIGRVSAAMHPDGPVGYV